MSFLPPFPGLPPKFLRKKVAPEKDSQPFSLLSRTTSWPLVLDSTHDLNTLSPPSWFSGGIPGPPACPGENQVSPHQFHSLVLAHTFLCSLSCSSLCCPTLSERAQGQAFCLLSTCKPHGTSHDIHMPQKHQMSWPGQCRSWRRAPMPIIEVMTTWLVRVKMHDRGGPWCSADISHPGLDGVHWEAAGGSLTYALLGETEVENIYMPPVRL